MVRPATLDDIEMVKRLGKEFADEAGVTARVGWNDDNVEQLIVGLIESPDGVLLVSEEGMIGGLVSAHPFSGMRVFLEMFWRAKDGHGLELLKAAEVEAQALGAERMFMVAMDDMARTRRLYGHLGYDATEVQYMKELG